MLDSIDWELGVNVLAACSLLALSLADPFLHCGIDRLQTALQLRPGSPFGDRGLYAFRKLGWRVFALAGLGSLGLATGIYVISVELPRVNAPLAWKLGIAVLLVVGWLLLLCCLRRLQSRGTVLRTLLILPVARRLAKQLNDNWPTSDGALPWIGRFRVHAETPNMLIVEDAFSRFPLMESCGAFIRRDPAGIIRFDLASRPDIYLALEVFFNEGEPHTYADEFNGFSINRRLVSSLSVGKHLYVAWYDSDFAEMTEKGVDVLLGVAEHLMSEIANPGNGQGCKLFR